MSINKENLGFRPFPPNGVIFECQKNPGLPPCDFPPAQSLETLDQNAEKARKICQQCPKVKGRGDAQVAAKIIFRISRLGRS